MSPIRLNGSTSGYSQIDAPATAGNNTLVLPGGNGTDAQVLSTNGSGTLSWVDRGRMVLETAKASTSGTFVDFTGIPSWVKRVTVMFQGVSTNGTSQVIIQIGTSAGYVTSGYLGSSGRPGSETLRTEGFGTSANGAAADVRHGMSVITSMGNNIWAAQSMIGLSNAGSWGGAGGTLQLGGTLDRIRITTVNGTDTFDAGSINILYEG